jgi:hypothetical protein
MSLDRRLTTEQNTGLRKGKLGHGTHAAFANHFLADSALLYRRIFGGLS